VAIGDFGELVVGIIEAIAMSPAWRDRVRLEKGFAEVVARTLVELEHAGTSERYCHVCRTIHPDAS
jgi:hypothetical protein